MSRKKLNNCAQAFVLSGLIVVGLVFFAQQALSGHYAISAHGDSSYGVLREGLDTNYTQGNCAHCHEQHASIDGSEPSPTGTSGGAYSALFHTTFNSSKTHAPYAQSDLFCFYCHSDVVGESIQSGAGEEMKNYDYSHTFGLYTGGAYDVDDIMESFNLPDTVSTGSNHNLLGLQDYASTNFSYFFGTNSDPCTACHNPHIAKRNKVNLWDSSYSAVSLPSDHHNHWGDEAGEQMSSYAANYEAPYTYNSTTTFEPGGYASSDPTLMPDYNTFCLECHDTTAAQVYSQNNARNLKQIYWGGAGGDAETAGDKHGVNVATGDVDTKAPYNNTSDLVLACCDCHEPHGSPYGSLVRRSINGQAVGEIGVTIGDRGHQCRQCHKDDLEMGIGGENEWKGTHHGGGAVTDNPYKTNQLKSCGCHGPGTSPIPCDDCHGHGKFVSGSATTPVYTDPDDGIGTIDVPPPFDSVGRKTF